MKKVLIKQVDGAEWIQFTQHDLEHGTPVSGDFALEVMEVMQWRDGRVLDFEFGIAYEVTREPGSEPEIKRLEAW